MNCPHGTHLTNGAIECAVAETHLAGPSNPNYPCDRCQSEWTDGPPDPDDRSTWTPTLLSFVEPFGSPEQLPAPAVECFNLGQVLVQSCCNKTRVYQCTTPTASGRERTTVPDCMACDAYDPDE